MASRIQPFNTDQMNLAAILHQNQLMWGRLQTLMAIQTAVIALALLGPDSCTVAITAIGFGFGISVCLCLLYLVDRRHRKAYEDGMSDRRKPVDPSGAFLDTRGLGNAIFWIIAVAFFIADGFTLTYLL